MNRWVSRSDRSRADMGKAGAIAVLSLLGVVALLPGQAQGQSLNQQMTVYLNSGSRSPQRDRADQLMGVGKVHADMGDWDGAIVSWQQAQQLYLQAGDMDGQGLAFNYLAIAYAHQGLPRATEDALRRQLAVSRDQRDFNTQIYVNNNLGQVLAPRAGGSPAAGSLFIEGLDVAASVRNHRGEAHTAKNMIWLANSLNQPELNTREYEMAFLPPSEWVANPISYGIKLGQHGDRRMAEQCYYMATQFYGVTETMAKAGNSPALQLAALDRLVKAYRIMGRYDLARDALDTRLQVVQKLGRPQEELAILTAQGELNREIGRTLVARKYYEQALAVAQRLNNQQQADLIRGRLADLENEVRK